MNAVKKCLWLSSIAFINTVTSAYAITAKEIISQAEHNASGFKDMSQRMSMKNVSNTGEIAQNEMWVRVLTDQGNTRSLTVFTQPARDKGIALLSQATSNGESQQWLYLPTSKRVKKIAAGNRESSFRGSEFTFEDLAGMDSSAYQFELIGEKPCGNDTCYVLDRMPKMDTSAYSHTHLYIDKLVYLPRQAEFFDKKGQPLKSLSFENYQKHENQFWKPEILRMKNLQTGCSTEIDSLKVDFNTGLKESVFTEANLRSGL